MNYKIKYLLILSLFFVILSGCGAGSKSSISQNIDNSQKNTEFNAKCSEKKKITDYCIDKKDKNDYKSCIKSVIEKDMVFIESYTNGLSLVMVSFQDVDQFKNDIERFLKKQDTKKIISSIKSKEICDIYHEMTLNVPKFFSLILSENNLEDINEEELLNITIGLENTLMKLNTVEQLLDESDNEDPVYYKD